MTAEQYARETYAETTFLFLEIVHPILLLKTS